MAELFEGHWPRMHRAAFLITGDAAAAEDIAQEAFLAAIRALDRFDMRRPLGPWLHRIAVNRAIDWSRARALRREVTGAPDDEPAAALAHGIDEELLAALQALGSNSARSWCCATCSISRRVRSHAHLDLPRGTVNSRLRRGIGCHGAASALRKDDRELRHRPPAPQTVRSPRPPRRRAHAPGRSCSAAYRGRRPARAAARAPRVRARRRSSRRARARSRASPLRPPRRRSSGGSAFWAAPVLGIAGRRPPAPVAPGGGRLLVQREPTAVGLPSAGRHRRRLGLLRRRVVVAARPVRGRLTWWVLTATEPSGRVRWSLSRPPASTPLGGRPSTASGSPTSPAPALRVVTGDGSGDRRFGAPPARASRRLGGRTTAHVLAYVDARQRVTVAAVDLRRRLWRSGRVPGALALSVARWAPVASGRLSLWRCTTRRGASWRRSTWPACNPAPVAARICRRRRPPRRPARGQRAAPAGRGSGPALPRRSRGLDGSARRRGRQEAGRSCCHGRARGSGSSSTLAALLVPSRWRTSRRSSHRVRGGRRSRARCSAAVAEGPRGARTPYLRHAAVCAPAGGGGDRERLRRPRSRRRLATRLTRNGHQHRRPAGLASAGAAGDLAGLSRRPAAVDLLPRPARWQLRAAQRRGRAARRRGARVPVGVPAAGRQGPLPPVGVPTAARALHAAAARAGELRVLAHTELPDRFRAAGRPFQVVVALGSHAGPARRAQTLRALDSLRIMRLPPPPPDRYAGWDGLVSTGTGEMLRTPLGWPAAATCSRRADRRSRGRCCYGQRIVAGAPEWPAAVARVLPRDFPRGCCAGPARWARALHPRRAPRAGALSARSSRRARSAAAAGAAERESWAARYGATRYASSAGRPRRSGPRPGAAGCSGVRRLRRQLPQLGHVAGRVNRAGRCASSLRCHLRSRPASSSARCAATRTILRRRRATRRLRGPSRRALVQAHPPPVRVPHRAARPATCGVRRPAAGQRLLRGGAPSARPGRLRLHPR